MSGCGCGIEMRNREERKILWLLLVINGTMFVIEILAGWLAESTGLIADSLDMLADATVYGIALYAVGKAATDKAHAALISGIFQILLALGVVADVIRRFVLGSDPLSDLMIGVGSLALIANLTCLGLISKHREGAVHMRASWIFSVNDVLANLGVIGAGALVTLTGSRLPDLVIGLLIAVLVLSGGIRIIREARTAYQAPTCG